MKNQNKMVLNSGLTMLYHKSPLRYPGGKSRALRFLKDFFPKDFKEYREPFFGGGSVGIYLFQELYQRDSIFCPKPYEIKFFANDLNYNVYCFWQVLKVQNEEMINEIYQIKERFKDGRELYENLLEHRDCELSDFQRAVDFFILNRITFSGVVDCGGYSQKAFESRFTQSSIERLRTICEVIKNFYFSAEDYAVLLEKEGESVFVFLDPPYFSVRGSKLYGKKGDLHRNFDHQRLCEKLKKTQHKFLLTYDDSDFIRELYRDFYIQEWNLQYGMNNFKREKANMGKELLISNDKFLKKE